MNKYLIIPAVLAVSAFTSCQDEDFGHDSQSIQYETNFKRTFGDIPEGQNWDFYAQAVNSNVTRAISGEGVSVSGLKTYGSEMDAIIASAKATLPEGRINSAKGQLAGELTSTGAFSVYTVLYGGGHEKERQYNFKFGIEYNGNTETIFERYNGDNPKNYRDITIPAGEKYRFYIDFDQFCWRCLGTGWLGAHSLCNGTGRIHQTYYSDGEHCRTIYDNVTGETEQTMVLGFEDLDFENSDCDKDFNDFIVCLKGQLPMLEAKRYMCEDLGGNKSTDLDFNDIVFDIQPSRLSGTDVIIRAVGGTLPIKLYVGNTLIGDGELHEYFDASKDAKGLYPAINVGEATTYEAKTYNLSDLPIDDLTNFNTIRAEVTYPDGNVQEISFQAQADGTSPKIFAVPVSTAWMKENKNIKNDGYEGFFDQDEWYNHPTHTDNLYQE